MNAYRVLAAPLRQEAPRAVLVALQTVMVVRASLSEGQDGTAADWDVLAGDPWV